MGDEVGEGGIDVDMAGLNGEDLVLIYFGLCLGVACEHDLTECIV